jgi:hypothetical protein
MATLTLTIDDDLLRRAELLAAAKHTTVPEMVERLLRVVAQPAPKPEELPPHTRRAYGMLPAIGDEEVERILDEDRMRKYGGVGTG